MVHKWNNSIMWWIVIFHLCQTMMRRTCLYDLWELLLTTANCFLVWWHWCDQHSLRQTHALIHHQILMFIKESLVTNQLSVCFLWWILCTEYNIINCNKSRTRVRDYVSIQGCQDTVHWLQFWIKTINKKTIFQNLTFYVYHYFCL